MPSFLFWNLARKVPAAIVGDACHENNIDIVLLAESDVASSEPLRSLNSKGEFRFTEFVGAIPSAIRFYSRLPRTSVHAAFDDGRVAIRRVRPPLGCELLVVACHLPSKVYRDPEEQYYRIRKLRQDIVNAEQTAKHQNSMVIGDLNLNPFEDGMTAADGMHAVMDKEIAARNPRAVQGQKWDFFYNPMWSRLGDESRGPSGTFLYQRSGSLVNYYWNTFDQVLLRPALLPFYHQDNLQVLTRINDTSLVAQNSISVSDHLPIVIRSKLKGRPNVGEFLEHS
jgi:Endonuclease/Exonuclease/phosphatase family